MKTHLVFFRFLAVGEEREGSGFILENEELFCLGWVFGEEDLFPVDVSPDNDSQCVNQFHLVFGRELLFVPNLLDLIDIQQKSVCLPHVLGHSCPFLFARCVDIDQLWEESFSNVGDQIEISRIAGDCLEVGLF